MAENATACAGDSHGSRVNLPRVFVLDGDYDARDGHAGGDQAGFLSCDFRFSGLEEGASVDDRAKDVRLRNDALAVLPDVQAGFRLFAGRAFIAGCRARTGTVSCGHCGGVSELVAEERRLPFDGYVDQHESKSLD